MKKIAAVLLVFCLMISGIAFAESTPDFSQFTDEMLLELYGYVQDEVERRGLSVSRSVNTEPIELKEGQYVVGEDIPAGSYTVTCTLASNEDVERANAMGDAYSSLFGAMGNEEMGSAFGSLFSSIGSLAGDPKAEVKIIGAYGAELKYFTLRQDESTTVTLNEGTAVRISDGTCTFTPNN